MVDDTLEPGDQILVTGASGFVGRAVCQALREAGLRPKPVGRHEIGDIHRGTDWYQALEGCGNADSAKQVMAGLQSMAESNRQSLPASGIALLAKAQTLLGLHQEALRSFEAALKMDPTNRSYQINFGAARLAAGNLDGGLKQLRTVWNSGLDNLDSETLGALFRNLSTAEAKNNHPLEALQLRRHWMRWNPQGATPKRWLTWAQRGINAHQTDARLFQESLDFLKDLHAAFPSDRSIKTALAETLEEAGNYREAALLFRDLLKTS